MPLQETSDLDLLIFHAHQAGEIARGFFESTNEVWMKDGNSPVSQADMAVDKYLRENLMSARPDYGWLSEETEDDEKRLKRQQVFVVDPIDGTRGFIAGSPNWCVSLAIVENGRPVAGVLSCPALGLLFSASEGNPTRVNGETVCARLTKKIGIVTGSKKVSGQLKQLADLQVIEPLPSLAYRIALVANGKVDAVFAHAGAHDWDLAAADIIVGNAGGFLCGKQDEALTYNCPKPTHGPLIAGAQNNRVATLQLAKTAGIIH